VNCGYEYKKIIFNHKKSLRFNIKKSNIVLGVVVVMVIFCFWKIMFSSKHNESFSTEKIRQMAVAGQFYPSDFVELDKMLNGFLQNTSSSAVGVMPQIIIVPHAGYIYSGQVAAFGFKSLQAASFSRAVLIGRSHQHYFEGVAADGNDVWQTPLGRVAVDKDFIAKLTKMDEQIKINSHPHQTEHCLEVEIPFLQKVLGNDIKIVPLLFGDEEIFVAQKLADALAKIIDDKTVVVISSDLSHYPEYAMAKELDQKTIEMILDLDVEKLHQENRKAQEAAWKGVATLACAEPAIVTAMFLAQKMGLKSQLLKYANSGDYFPESKERVVGYAAIAFFKETQYSLLGENNLLNQTEQEIALQIARKAIQAYLQHQDYTPAVKLPVFQQKQGVFVTLKKQGHLHGCIGNFMPSVALAENIKQMALAAAFNDPRFLPLQPSELKDINIEISILSPLQKISDPQLIEVGKHGVYIKSGNQSGVYLPQVATELGWDREQFLNSLCEEKVGLKRDCWKDSTAELFVFTVQAFSEK